MLLFFACNPTCSLIETFKLLWIPPVHCPLLKTTARAKYSNSITKDEKYTQLTSYQKRAQLIHMLLCFVYQVPMPQGVLFVCLVLFWGFSQNMFPITVGFMYSMYNDISFDFRQINIKHNLCQNFRVTIHWSYTRLRLQWNVLNKITICMP